MGGYVDDRIFDSTINLEHELHVRWTLTGFIVLSNREGILNLTRAAFARRLNLSVSQLADAITILSLPDPHAATDDPTRGRRIEPIDMARDWGWRLLNKEQYLARANRNEQRENAKQRKQSQREREQSALFALLGGEPHAADVASRASHMSHVSRVTSVVRHSVSRKSPVTHVTQPAQALADGTVNMLTTDLSHNEDGRARVSPSPNTQTLTSGEGSNTRNVDQGVNALVGDLASAADLWNALADEWGVAHVRPDTAASCIEAWRRARPKLIKCAGEDVTLVEVVRRVAQNVWLHHKGFMTFKWLFGQKNGELNAEKIWQCRYGENSNGDAGDVSRGVVTRERTAAPTGADSFDERARRRRSTGRS